MIPLTDERLKQIAYDDIVCASEQMRAMAVELIAARARIAELKGRIDNGMAANREERIARDELRVMNGDLRARIAELEAAQRPPLGYVVVEPGCDRVAYRGEIWEDRETGEFYAAEDASMRLVELREVQS